VIHVFRLEFATKADEVVSEAEQAERVHVARPTAQAVQLLKNILLTSHWKVPKQSNLIPDGVLRAALALVAAGLAHSSRRPFNREAIG
jgi:hypothetical protein